MIYEKASKAAEILNDEFKGVDTGLFLGTGLGNISGFMKILQRVPYSDIPHFPVSTVESHAGEMLLAEISGRKVIAMNGRFHLYEGYSPEEVAFPVLVMQLLGVKTLIVTNAAGGLNLDFNAGDLMLIKDHINLTGENPLVGPNDDRIGIRFPDMSGAYDKALISKTLEVADSLNLEIRTGVYAGLKGPSLETPAENRFLKIIGADAVGLSTVTEVIAANHAGMKVLGISTITNINNPNDPEPATIEEVVEVAGRASLKLARLLEKIMENM